MGVILSYCIKEAERRGKKSVRVDTHMDNKPMRASLVNNGFEELGELTLLSGSEEGDKRLGFERLI